MFRVVELFILILLVIVLFLLSPIVSLCVVFLGVIDLIGPFFRRPLIGWD